MRIILQTFYILLLLLLSVVSAAMGGSLAVVAAGSGPAAVAAGIYALLQNLLVILSFLLGVLPFILVVIANLLIVFASGYRFLHWMRYLNFALNCLASFYFLWLFEWNEFGIGIAIFLVVLGILSLFIPKKANIPITRKVIYYFQYGFYLFVMLPMFWVIATVEGLTGIAVIGAILFFLGLWLTHYNAKLTLQTDGSLFTLGLYKRLGFSGALSGLYTLILPIYGFPLLFGWILIVQLVEEALLYPVAMPADKSKYRHFVRIFGRLPDKKDNEDENERKEEERDQKEEPGDAPEYGIAPGDD